MVRQRQIRIGREGVYYSLVLLAVLVGATARQLNLLMLVGSMLAGPLLFSLIYGRVALRRIVVRRKLPPDLRADQQLTVDISVTNCRRWIGIWTIEVEDRVERQGTAQSDNGAVTVGVFCPHIAPRETKQVSYRGHLPKRGRYGFGPLRISTRFPLGLIRHSLVLDQNDALLVHPKLGRLSHDWAEVVRENPMGTQRMQRRGLLEADFYGLRDWRPGDSRRSIHWRTSARRGSLVVRQFEQRRSQDLALLVDLWQPPSPTEQHLKNVEKAVSFAATVIAEACRQSGRNLMLTLAAATAAHRAGTASPFFFREQMDLLALVAPHTQPHLPQSLGHALALVSLSTPTLLISTRPIEWDALRAAAAERDVELAGRQLQCIDVGSEESNRFYQD